MKDSTKLVLFANEYTLALAQRQINKRKPKIPRLDIITASLNLRAHPKTPLEITFYFNTLL